MDKECKLKVVTEGLFEKTDLSQDLKAESRRCREVRVIPVEEGVNAKVLRQQSAWCVQGVAGRPVQLERSKQEGRASKEEQ